MPDTYTQFVDAVIGNDPERRNEFRATHNRREAGRQIYGIRERYGFSYEQFAHILGLHNASEAESLELGNFDGPGLERLLQVKRTVKEKAMITKEEQELEDFIEEWYYGEDMHKFAKALGRYLLKFIDHLSEEDMSQATRRKHIDNCWYIGYLECNFGYRDEFVAEDIFYSPKAQYEEEFARKIRSSKSAMTSYRSTWRKLYAYARGLGHVS